MQNSWLSLIPPLIVLACALATHKLLLSLTIGLVTACLIATDFSVLASTELIFKRLINQVTDSDSLYMYGFLLFIGIIVTVISHTGGANAFARIITKRLRNARMVETSSFLLSLVLFIDDYLSNLTTGYIMRPLTDRFKIPRSKLAFLVHSMTGPLVILAPISSWVAMITGQLDQAGITRETIASTKIIADPFFVYINTLPYIFYSFLIITSVWFIIRKKISFGPMHQHEIIAQTTGNLFGGKTPLIDPLEKTMQTNGSAADLLVPLIMLISCVMIGIPYAGGYHLFGGTRTLIDAFKHNTETFFVLFAAGAITLTISLLSALWRNRITMRAVPNVIYNGILLMLEPVIMLVLASTLGTLLKTDLLTGNYLATLMLGAINIALLPVMFFIVSAVTATITGSSWGTIALLLPIAVPMLTSLALVPIPTTPDQIMILFPVLGAIFSGSVCGDHLSPISETTIMAATSSGTYPIDHARTQFPYAAPALICSALSFLISGFLINYPTWINVGISLGVGLSVCLGLLYIADKKK